MQCDLNLKQIEDVLYVELKNWAAWARKKDYLPPPVRCVLGSLYIRDEDEECEKVERRMPIDELEAQAMEGIINQLPVKQRSAFIMHHLQRGILHGRIITLRGRQRQAQALGVGVRQYHYLLQRAHQGLLMKWRAAGYL